MTLNNWYKAEIDFFERFDPSNYKIGLKKNFHLCPFIWIEAKVEAIGQKWEFGQTKKNFWISIFQNLKMCFYDLWSISA